MPQRSRKVIVTTQFRDLYYGEITATDEEIAVNKAVRVENCRHIAYWRGPRGGITSLAAIGPTHNESRIGAPTSMLVTGVAHILDVSPAAVRVFDALRSE